MSDSETAISTAKPPGPASPLGIAIIAGTLIVDQVTKLIADATLEPNGTVVDVLPILGLSFCAVLAAQMHGEHAWIAGAIALAATVNWAWARRR